MGFAVVAEEVRSLAQRCAQAAKDTAEIIESSMRRTKEGQARLEELAGSVRAVGDQVVQVQALVERVSHGSSQQRSGIEQISGAISQLEIATQQSTTISEESAAAAEELQAQAKAVREAVSELSRLLVGN